MADVMASGTPQTALVADAARQNQFGQAFFYTLGDLFAGTDSSLRMASGTGNSVDVGVDAYGQPYLRGTTTSLPTSASQQASAAITIKPELLLMGLVFAYFLLRKS